LFLAQSRAESVYVTIARAFREKGAVKFDRAGVLEREAGLCWHGHI